MTSLRHRECFPALQVCARGGRSAVMMGAILLSIAMSTGYAKDNLPPGTYECGTNCVDKTINNQKCQVCTTSLCKKGPQGEYIAGNKTTTSCEAAQTRPPIKGGIVRPLAPPTGGILHRGVEGEQPAPSEKDGK